MGRKSFLSRIDNGGSVNGAKSASGPDYALFPVVYNSLFCQPGGIAHCWTFTTSTPYSSVWYGMNLFFLWSDTPFGRRMYGFYVLALDAILTVVFWKWKRIPHRYLAILCGMSIWYYYGQGSEYQNVSILMLMPLMFLAQIGVSKVSKKRLTIFAALPILIKLPIGWSLPWIVNDHEICVVVCSGGTHGLANLLMLPIINYGILCWAWYWTIGFVKGKYQ